MSFLFGGDEMRTMTLTEARAHMSELADPVDETLLMRNGEPVAVVLGIDAYRSYRTLLELAQDPERYQRVLTAHRRVQAGNLDSTRDLAEIEGMMDETKKQAGAL